MCSAYWPPGYVDAHSEEHINANIQLRKDQSGGVRAVSVYRCNPLYKAILDTNDNNALEDLLP